MQRKCVVLIVADIRLWMKAGGKLIAVEEEALAYIRKNNKK